MNRREFLAGAAFAGAAGWAAKGARGEEVAVVRPASRTWSYDGQAVRIDCPGLREGVRVWVVGDTHFALRDARDDAFAEHCRRMGQWGAKKEAFEKMLARAARERPDMLLLVGDILSFPTLANVEYVKARLDGCGVPWFYVAGNHDWHFEGDAGSDLAQRAKWTKDRLAPLYGGADPLMASRVVKGVRIVAIDNSAYHVLPEQTAFWKTEAAKGDPVALMMHIPFWHPGWGVFTCGCPTWGAATDPYWKIERRERWAERQMASTFAFRDAVFATPNLVGVFTGHEHCLQFAQAEGAACFGTPSNRNGAFLDVRIGGGAG